MKVIRNALGSPLSAQKAENETQNKTKKASFLLFPPVLFVYSTKAFV